MWSVVKLLIRGPWGGTRVSFACLPLSVSFSLPHTHRHSLSSQLTQSTWNKRSGWPILAARKYLILSPWLWLWPFDLSLQTTEMRSLSQQEHWKWLGTLLPWDELGRINRSALNRRWPRIPLAWEWSQGGNCVLGMKLLLVILFFPDRRNEIWNYITPVTKRHANLQVWELEEVGKCRQVSGFWVIFRIQSPRFRFLASSQYFFLPAPIHFHPILPSFKLKGVGSALGNICCLLLVHWQCWQTCSTWL